MDGVIPAFSCCQVAAGVHEGLGDGSASGQGLLEGCL